MELGRKCGECKTCVEQHSSIPECVWLEGWGEKDDRPDMSGIRIDRVLFGKNLVGAVKARPLWVGAERTQEGQSAVCTASMRLDLPVIVVDFNEERILYVVGKGIQ